MLVKGYFDDCLSTEQERTSDWINYFLVVSTCYLEEKSRDTNFDFLYCTRQQ